MRWLVALIGISTLVLVLWARDYPKKIQEFPEPWQVLDPGTPRARFPTPRVIAEGGGPVIGPGDLVQVHIRSKSQIPGRLWNDRGNWWIWIGFSASEETSFFSIEPRTASALMGLREGSTIEFVDANDGTGKDPDNAGVLSLNVFGDQGYYRWRKNVEGGSANIYVSTSKTPSPVEIKRVCKGQAKYRTVRLFDDSPTRICQGLSCYVTNESRLVWFDEAEIKARCGDGKVAVFQYGPTRSASGKEGASPKHGYFDEWFRKAWNKLPKGVQFEGNHPPESTGEAVDTRSDITVLVRPLDNDRDEDGDKMSARVIVPPSHGKLEANADGSFLYTPAAGFSGSDQFSYKVSDGLVESEIAHTQIYVKQQRNQNRG